jgi:hypothetical protein
MSKTKVETKKCTKCPPGENIKPITDFYVCKGGKIRSSCKKCDNAMSRAYKAKSKKYISSYNKKYKEDHRDEISIYNHEYNKNNRETIQKRQTKTRRIRRINDFNFYIATDLRARLNNFIATKGITDPIIESVIGCNYKALEKWLTYLFDAEMTFKNYGEYWTIDHVNPCSIYDLTKEENLNECFNWRNLRPMIKINNSKKTNKIIIDDQNNHLILIKIFWNALSDIEKNNYI